MYIHTTRVYSGSFFWLLTNIIFNDLRMVSVVGYSVICVCVVPMLSKNLNKDTKIEFSNFLLDSYTLPLIILASNIPCVSVRHSQWLQEWKQLVNKNISKLMWMFRQMLSIQLRSNLSGVFLFKQSNKKRSDLIYEEYVSQLTKEEYKKFEKWVWRKRHDVLFISFKLPHRYWRNFKELTFENLTNETKITLPQE